MAFVQRNPRLIRQSLRRGIVQVKRGNVLTGLLEPGRDFDQLGRQLFRRYILLSEGLEKPLDGVLSYLQISRDLVTLALRLIQQLIAGALPITERFDEFRQAREIDLI